MHRNRLFCLFLLLAVNGWALAQPTSSLDVYVTLSSDYMNRGMSQTDGAGALQAGADYRHASGFFAGAWLSNVDFASEATRSRPREFEVDYYVGYSRDRDRLSWAVTLARYAYPDISVSYDYTELSFSLSFKDRFSYQASHTDHLLSLGTNALNQELGMTLPLYRNFELGAAVGVFRSADLQEGEYTHFNLGVSKIFKRWTFDMRYYDTNYDRVTHLGKPADRQWVVSASYGFDPI